VVYEVIFSLPGYTSPVSDIFTANEAEHAVNMAKAKYGSNISIIDVQYGE